MTQPTRGAALCLMLATSALLAAGCKKEKESLVIAQLQLAAPDPRAASLTSVSLALTPGPTRIFPLAYPLSADTSTDFGVYLSGDITGDVMIVAIASPETGCVGFRGTGHVTIGAAGATETAKVSMTATDVCPSDGGGVGGTTGAGGGAGTGGSSAGRGGTSGSAGGAGTTGAGGSGGSTAGTGGSGGSATGTGGAAGASGGRGGAAGGAGTTGTGGMAGYPSISNCRPFNHGAASCPSISVRAVAVSPNGQLIATAGDDYRVKIWNFDGQSLSAAGPVFTANDSIHGVAFSPDGTKLAFVDGGTVRTYTVSGWAPGTTLLGDGGNDTLQGVGFTPDSKRVISVDDKGLSGGNVYVHDITSTTGLPALMKNVTDEPWSFAVSPKAASDGSVGIAVGSYYGTIQVLGLTSTGFSGPANLKTRKPSTSADPTPVDTVQFSADGTILAEGEDYGAVRFWSYPLSSATPPTLADGITFAGGDSVNALAFAPNGTYFALGGAFFNGQLSIYGVTNQTEAARLAAPTLAHNIASLAFSPNGAAIIAGEDDCGTVLVCN